MKKRINFAAAVLAVVLLATAACAKPTPEDVEDFGGKTKAPKTFNVSNADQWAVAVKTIDGGGNDRNYVVNVMGLVGIPALEGNTFSRPHSNVNISLRGAEGDAALILSGEGSLIALAEGEHLVLRDITLKGAGGNTAPLVYEGGGSSLTMKAGAAVSGNVNVSDDDNGSGVHVASGAVFTMEGGTISGNGDGGGGDNGLGKAGGVYVAAGGNFTLREGTITGNGALMGGGVYVDGYYNEDADVEERGTFTMEGGTISGNTGSSKGGGVYVAIVGDFTLREGTISGNDALAGGGIYVDGRQFGSVEKPGTFVMEGGTISGNIAGRAGWAGGFGGGVGMSQGSFTLRGGEISGNSAGPERLFGGAGGGVCVSTWSIFTMEGGEIYGNTAAGVGGGMYLESSAFFLKGGIVRGSDAGDKANKAGQGASLYEGGRAVAVYSDGSPIIRRGNFSNGTLTGR
jgi:hypothetical protein